MFVSISWRCLSPPVPPFSLCLPSLPSLCPPLGFDAAKQADRLYKHFGPGTPFEATRKQSASPKQGCWTNHNLKTFIAKREEGDKEQSDTGSKDPDGLVKAIAVVAMHQGQPDLLDKVEQCVRVTQVSRPQYTVSLLILPPFPPFFLPPSLPLSLLFISLPALPSVTSNSCPLCIGRCQDPESHDSHWGAVIQWSHL